MAGFGGQGIMLMGRTLAVAGMREGGHVTWLPSYGPEMRGGTAHYFVVISTDPVTSPYITEPDSVVAMNRPSLDRFREHLSSEGLLVVNESLVGDYEDREDVTTVSLDATGIATDLGNKGVANMVALGAFTGIRSTPALSSVTQALAEVLPERHSDMLEMNETALKRGAREVSGIERPH